jgi:hypothetical protein
MRGWSATKAETTATANSSPTAQRILFVLLMGEISSS